MPTNTIDEAKHVCASKRTISTMTCPFFVIAPLAQHKYPQTTHRKEQVFDIVVATPNWEKPLYS